MRNRSLIEELPKTDTRIRSDIVPYATVGEEASTALESSYFLPEWMSEEGTAGNE